MCLLEQMMLSWRLSFYLQNQSLSCDDFSCGIPYSTIQFASLVCVFQGPAAIVEVLAAHDAAALCSFLHVPAHCILHPALRVSHAELWVGKCQHEGQIPRKWDYWWWESDWNEGQVGEGGLVLSPKQFSLGQDSSSVWKAEKEVLEKAFCHAWWAEA